MFKQKKLILCQVSFAFLLQQFAEMFLYIYTEENSIQCTRHQSPSKNTQIYVNEKTPINCAQFVQQKNSSHFSYSESFICCWCPQVVAVVGALYI